VTRHAIGGVAAVHDIFWSRGQIGLSPLN